MAEQFAHTVPAGKLAGALDGIMRALLGKPPEALQQTQHLLRHGTHDEILERMQLESAAFTERLASSEVGEAIAAFFEKRKPDFSRLA